MTKTPFPLTEEAEKRGLRVFREECWEATPKCDREWFVEMRNREGFLYGHNECQFWVDTTSGRAAKYLALNPLSSMISPDGGEARFLFSRDQLDAVLSVFKARKKRKLSEAGRKRLAEAGKSYRFSRG